MSVFTPRRLGGLSPKSTNFQSDKTARSLFGSNGSSGSRLAPPLSSPDRTAKTSFDGFDAGKIDQIEETPDREGIFALASVPGAQVRLKLPTIINRCRLYARSLAAALGEPSPPYRLPYSADEVGTTTRELDKYLETREPTALRARLENVERDLGDALGTPAEGHSLRPFALGALAGELAAEAGLVGAVLISWSPMIGRHTNDGDDLSWPRKRSHPAGADASFRRNSKQK